MVDGLCAVQKLYSSTDHKKDSKDKQPCAVDWAQWQRTNEANGQIKNHISLFKY